MVTVDSSELYSLLQSLVNIPSISSDRSAINELLNFIQSYFSDTKWIVEENHSSDNTNPILFIHPEHSVNNFDVLFLVHGDVVPANTYQLLGSPDGMVYGRGVIDDKGPASACLYLLRQLDPKNYNIAILMTSDEEIDGLGTQYAFLNPEGLQLRSNVVIVPDGGRDFYLISHEKGILETKLTVKGSSCHGSRPWEGINPLPLLFSDIQRLMEVSVNNQKVFWSTGDDHWKTTCVPTVCSSGSATNQVPDSAYAILDIRYTEQWSLHKLKELINSTVQHSTVEFLFEASMMATDQSSPYLLQAKKTIEKHIGRSCPIVRAHGASDGRFVTQVGLPVVMFLPDGNGAHSADERLNFPTLISFLNIIIELISLWT